jgi:hypothetical protein
VGAAGAGRGGVDLGGAGGPGQRAEHEGQEVGAKRQGGGGRPGIAVDAQGRQHAEVAAEKRREQERGPRRAADRQPGERAASAGARPPQDADQTGHELGHRDERHQAEVGQLGALAQPEVDRVTGEDDRGDQAAAQPAQPAVRIAAHGPGGGRAAEVVLGHRRQGDRGDDDHRGGGGQRTEEHHRGQDR